MSQRENAIAEIDAIIVRLKDIKKAISNDKKLDKTQEEFLKRHKFI